MNRENSFSLTIMVIIMALLAIFVGYLLGNWLIQMVTGDTSDSHQVVQKKIVEEETVKDTNKSEFKTNQSTESSTVNKDNKTEDEDYVKQQLKGDVYVVQVGAFKNYENALSLKNQLSRDGFQVIITEGIPYKVQLGATNSRTEAEETEEKVESMGYQAFITR